VDIVLNVNSPQAMNRLDLTVDFDPQVLQALEASEGGFLQQPDAPLVMIRNIDQASGQIQLQLSSRGKDGISGAGSLVTLTFEALAASAGSPVSVSRLAPSGPGGEALPATLPGAHVIKVVP
jgi:general secretion pathway protein D